MNEKAWARSVMLSFAILNVFYNIQSTRNTFLPNSTTTFPFIDIMACTIHSNQTLDASIKYVA